MSARIVVLAALLAACKTEDPGTSVRVALRYPDALGLDTADVTLSDRGSSGRIAHELLLLVPDDLAGQTMPITVWGLKDSRRAAYGETTATTTLGDTVTAEITLTACTPSCEGNVLTSCVREPVACPLGCSSDGDAHCIGPAPSNGISAGLVDALRGTTSIGAPATFNTDSGEILGGLTRAAGTGVVSGIGYFSQMQGGVPLGVFVFHSLDVAAGVTVSFTGSRAVVFLVGDSARIAGELDLDAGHGRQDLPGPGGGAGSTERNPAGSCVPGAQGGGGRDGMTSNEWDSGGGGGGHVDDGAPGGAGNGSAGGTISPGDGGAMCVDADFLQPLLGGGGGGKGGPGASATAASGGGGGGAIQITSLNQLVVTGVIRASGAGGEGGTMSVSNGGGGGGGGAGGSILLEAPIITLSNATLAAKGGGGGGGGGPQPVLPGENGGIGPATPQGSVANDAGGGTGGATSGPDVGTAGALDGGGGGGGRGRIVIRSESGVLTGVFTPRPDQARVRFQ